MTGVQTCALPICQHFDLQATLPSRKVDLIDQVFGRNFYTRGLHDRGQCGRAALVCGLGEKRDFAQLQGSRHVGRPGAAQFYRLWNELRAAHQQGEEANRAALEHGLHHFRIPRGPPNWMSPGIHARAESLPTYGKR